MRRLNPAALAIIIVALAVCYVCVPPTIRGVSRYYEVHKMLRNPHALERIAVQPKQRTLAPFPAVHPVNIGYANFDIGSASPVSMKVVGSKGTGVVLTCDDVHLLLMPPYGSLKSRGNSSEVSANQARKYPLMSVYNQKLETDSVAGEMEMEETLPVPLSELLWMNNDEYILYFTKLGYKSLNFGLNEVQFFHTPEAKGIVRIGKTATDRKTAYVFLSSPDGTRTLGFRLEMAAASSKDISTFLDPIIRSFRFTTDSVNDNDKIKALISGAGITRGDDIPQGKETETVGAPKKQ